MGIPPLPSRGFSQHECRIEADLVRRDIIEALWASGGGHYGGALSVVDITCTMYRRVLRVNPARPNEKLRDRLIFSKGHAAIALYAVLRRMGFFEDSLASYGSAGSRLQGHPDMTMLPGVDFSSGSLGQGLSVGLGMALALRTAGPPEPRVFVILGDGECQEGQIWEAAMLADRLRVTNLRVIVDANDHQEFGWRLQADLAGPPVLSLADKWAAFGWAVDVIDGHDSRALESACAVDSAGRPRAVLARTTKGKGFPLIEEAPGRFHCTQITRQEHEILLGFAARSAE